MDTPLWRPKSHQDKPEPQSADTLFWILFSVLLLLDAMFLGLAIK
jgi:hypothetical protein